MANNGDSKSKYSKEEKEQIKKFVATAQPLAAAALVVLAIIAYLFMNNKLDFTRYHRVSPNKLTDFAPRVKFVLQHLTLGVAWLLFSVFYVISRRVNSPAVDPTAGHEKRTEGARNNLTNSLEQFILSAVSQL